MTIVQQKKLRSLPACPIETMVAVAGNKWSIAILRELMSGTKRFGELQRGIGTISQKVLTTQLRSLEESGLLTRTVYAEVPPRVEYTLTEVGLATRPILDAMAEWGNNYKRMLAGY